MFFLFATQLIHERPHIKWDRAGVFERVKEGYMPLLNEHLPRLRIEVSAGKSQLHCSFAEVIIFIGYAIEDDVNAEWDPSYVIKFVPLYRKKEIDYLIAAYKAWQHHEYPITGEFNGKIYTLKMCWPETLFFSRDSGEFYEIMPMAKGIELSEYLSFFDKQIENEELWSHPKLSPISSAFAALGSILGKTFKYYGLPYDNRALDPHARNISFDPQTNTITWFDLELWGQYFESHNVTPMRSHTSTLGHAINTLFWRRYFTKPLNGESLFEHYIKSNNKHDQFESLARVLFNAIRTICESFCNAFIVNFNPEMRETLEAYFSTFSYAFQEIEICGTQIDFTRSSDLNKKN